MNNDIDRIFSEAEIELISKTLSCFTGTEIGQFLESISVIDLSPGMTKWKRLFSSLIEDQNRNKKGNNILRLIKVSLNPIRFVGKADEFFAILEQINSVLVFQGLEYRDDGRFHKVKEIKTLSESEKRVSLLKENIIKRHLNENLLNYCKEEYLADNYFHAVFEATKGISKLIRGMTELTCDGAELCDKAFSGNNPLIKINKYNSKTEISEQAGFNNLVKGVYGVFRNPVAHELKSEWSISEQDALDLFSTLSYIYRRISNQENMT